MFSTFDLMETCQVVSLLVHRKKLQVVTSANGVNWEKNAKLWVFYEALGVMNIEWDYNYYQPWSDNEWLVDEMLVMLDEDIIMQ